MDEMIPWATNYAAHFRPLQKQQIEAMEEVIRAKVRSLNQGDVSIAMDRICQSWDGRGNPTVKNIIDVIIAGKTQAKYGKDGKDLSGYKRRMESADRGDDMSYNSFILSMNAMGERRYHVTEADNTAEAIWGIICEPDDRDDCRKLEKWAQERLRFRREDVPFISEIERGSTDASRIERDKTRPREAIKAEPMAEYSPASIYDLVPF